MKLRFLIAFFIFIGIYFSGSIANAQSLEDRMFVYQLSDGSRVDIRQVSSDDIELLRIRQRTKIECLRNNLNHYYQMKDQNGFNKTNVELTNATNELRQIEGMLLARRSMGQKAKYQAQQENQSNQQAASQARMNEARARQQAQAEEYKRRVSEPRYNFTITTRSKNRSTTYSTNNNGSTISTYNNSRSGSSSYSIYIPRP